MRCEFPKSFRGFQCVLVVACLVSAHDVSFPIHSAASKVHSYVITSHASCLQDVAEVVPAGRILDDLMQHVHTHNPTLDEDRSAASPATAIVLLHPTSPEPPPAPSEATPRAPTLVVDRLGRNQYAPLVGMQRPEAHPHPTPRLDAFDHVFPRPHHWCRHSLSSRSKSACTSGWDATYHPSFGLHCACTTR
jgi:hypothetical protein